MCLQTKAAKHEALFELARSMLTEEAVRCTARLVRLLQLGGHNREELEEARGIYLSIVKDHLGKWSVCQTRSISLAIMIGG
jgi:hypothetical protein